MFLNFVMKKGIFGYNSNFRKRCLVLMIERLRKVFIVDGRLFFYVVGVGVMIGFIFNMGCEIRNGVDCCLVGMVFCFGFFEGVLFICDLRF